MTGEEWEEVEQAVEPPYGRAERIIIMVNITVASWIQDLEIRIGGIKLKGETE